MPLPDDQRRLLGAFLRRHREAMRPDLLRPRTSPPGRRRTPGLRREEVAELCGLSTTWYTWVEQGRDISLSAAALARLADALTAVRAGAEPTCLSWPAGEIPSHPPPARCHPRPRPASRRPCRAVTAPAYLLDRLWDIRAWNEAAARLLAPWLTSGESCLLRFVFLHPAARGFIYDWQERAAATGGGVPGRHGPCARRDPDMQALLADLLARSEPFARFWNDGAVLARDGGIRVFDHPQDGMLRFEQVTLMPAGSPDAKFVMLLPDR